MKSNQSTHLEPRVATLEAGLTRLTDDVRELSGAVRQQSATLSVEVQKLSIAVTQAQGPKQTDWSTIIAGLMLVVALGSAAFWPLSQVVTGLKAQQESNVIQLQQQEKTISELNGVDKVMQERVDWLVKMRVDQYQQEHEELNKWRHKAMGLDTSH